MFYVTMKSELRVSILLGPFDTKEEAEAHVAAAQEEAIKRDPYNHFYAFGVSRIDTEALKRIPKGILNQSLLEV